MTDFSKLAPGTPVLVTGTYTEGPNVRVYERHGVISEQTPQGPVAYSWHADDPHTTYGDAQYDKNGEVHFDDGSGPESLKITLPPAKVKNAIRRRFLIDKIENIDLEGLPLKKLEAVANALG